MGLNNPTVYSHLAPSNLILILLEAGVERLRGSRIKTYLPNQIASNTIFYVQIILFLLFFLPSCLQQSCLLPLIIEYFCSDARCEYFYFYPYPICDILFISIFKYDDILGYILISLSQCRQNTLIF